MVKKTARCYKVAMKHIDDYKKISLSFSFAEYTIISIICKQYKCADCPAKYHDECICKIFNHILESAVRIKNEKQSN